eukprot:2853588-Amphidinium_carterae.1
MDTRPLAWSMAGSSTDRHIVRDADPKKIVNRNLFWKQTEKRVESNSRRPSGADIRAPLWRLRGRHGRGGRRRGRGRGGCRGAGRR